MDDRRPDLPTRAVRRAEDLWVSLRAVYTQDRRLVVSTVLGFAIVALCGAAIAQLMAEVGEDDDLARFDQHVLDAVVEHRTPWWNGVAANVTHLGDPWVVTIVVAVVAGALVVWRRCHLAMFVVLASSGAAVVSSVTKQVFDRARPSSSLWLGEAWGPSFPSGHATQSIACWGAVAMVACVLVHSRAARVAIIGAALSIALAVGASRVYLAVHWASDVLCAWAISLSWLTTLLLTGWATPRARGVWSSVLAPEPGAADATGAGAPRAPQLDTTATSCAPAASGPT
jgi:undecaprenyl-diphosphatase